MRVISDLLPKGVIDACLTEDSQIKDIKFMQDVTIFWCFDSQKDQNQVYFIEQ